jgi:hypothetical protein
VTHSADNDAPRYCWRGPVRCHKCAVSAAHDGPEDLAALVTEARSLIRWAGEDSWAGQVVADLLTSVIPPAMTNTTQCRYMHAAYPSLTAEDSCSEHRHDAPTFALARAMAVAFQQPDPTDEQIGWCLDDAAEVVDDFDPAPLSWTVTPPELTREAGLDWTLTINGAEYVIQQNDSGGHVVVHPVSREQWDIWMTEAEGSDA